MIKIKKVFVVDDEPSLQFFYEKILTLNGFEIAGIANNGNEAISMFKSFLDKPKVIIMDYRMPEKNGIEASKEILQIDGNTKIIFISADNSVKEEALSIGAFCFQDKPFTIKQLIDQINKAFNNYMK